MTTRTSKTLIQLYFMGVFLVVILTGKMMIWLGLFAVSLVGALFFGRFYCGYICPMNTLMSIVEKFSKHFKWQTKSMPKILRSKALAWFVLLSMIAAMLVSRRFIHKDIPILLILMLLSIVVTLRFEQWVFHNKICPFGVLLNIAGRFARLSTKVNKESCVGCKKCESVCLSKAIKVVEGEKRAYINSSLCHQCAACSSVCPTHAIRYVV